MNITLHKLYCAELIEQTELVLDVKAPLDLCYTVHYSATLHYNKAILPS